MLSTIEIEAAPTESLVEPLVEVLKAAGEETRVRILVALQAGELTVSELTQVLGQSQPRISRHLKLMSDAGLIERRREGSWAFFRLSSKGFGGDVAALALRALSAQDALLQRDSERLDRVKRKRAETAEAYFRDNAAQWDRLRALHAADEAVEKAARDMLAPPSGKFSRFVDLGVGTGRMLELFTDRFEQGTGYDVNQQMLAFARSRLEAKKITNASLRQEDILALPEADGTADAGILHQVLHFLTDPSSALTEAARILKRGGRLLVVDFAPHDIEFLREQHAHRRLGFGRAEITEIAGAAGMAELDYREIPAPQSRGVQGLTVALWLFEKS